MEAAAVRERGNAPAKKARENAITVIIHAQAAMATDMPEAVTEKSHRTHRRIRAAMVHAYLVGSEGSKLELEFSGNQEVAVGRHVPNNAAVPFNVSLILENVEMDAPNDPGNNPSEMGAPKSDLTLVPGDRNSDFEISIPKDSNNPASPSVRVEMGRMAEEERKFYAELSEEELALILTNVRTIVASAEPGRSDYDTDELLNSLAAHNGYETLEEGRLFPLYFEGHQEIGFPVHVTVNIEKGLLDGGSELYVYHIAKDGAIELLGKAEYITYDDGSIESISFYTSSFSTFFTSAKELDLHIQGDEADPNLTSVNDNTTDGNKSVLLIPVILIAAAVIAALVIIAILFVKKRRS